MSKLRVEFCHFFIEDLFGMDQNMVAANQMFGRVYASEDAQSLYSVGKFFNDGRGIERCTDTAAKFLKASSKLGYARAFNVLGDIHSDFNGKFFNYFSAIIFGDSTAEKKLIKLYESQENKEGFLRWMDHMVVRAIESKHSYAICFQAKLLERGIIYAQNFDQARTYYEIAAFAGSPVAIQKMKSLYGYAEETSEKRKLRHLKYDAILGCADACYKLGVSHVEDNQQPEDERIGIDFLIKAVEKNHTEAEYYLAKPNIQRGLNVEELAKAFNNRNAAVPLSFDHLLNSRRFHGLIYKEENVYGDREVKEYIAENALMQLLESEKIKEKVRGREQDMWNY